MMRAIAVLLVMIPSVAACSDITYSDDTWTVCGDADTTTLQEALNETAMLLDAAMQNATGHARQWQDFSSNESIAHGLQQLQAILKELKTQNMTVENGTLGDIYDAVQADLDGVHQRFATLVEANLTHLNSQTRSLQAPLAVALGIGAVGAAIPATGITYLFHRRARTKAAYWSAFGRADDSRRAASTIACVGLGLAAAALLTSAAIFTYWLQAVLG